MPRHGRLPVALSIFPPLNSKGMPHVTTMALKEGPEATLKANKTLSYPLYQDTSSRASKPLVADPKLVISLMSHGARGDSSITSHVLKPHRADGVQIVLVGM